MFAQATLQSMRAISEKRWNAFAAVLTDLETHFGQNLGAKPCSVLLKGTKFVIGT
jgi:hypothetical protein